MEEAIPQCIEQKNVSKVVSKTVDKNTENKQKQKELGGTCLKRNHPRLFGSEIKVNSPCSMYLVLNMSE